MIPVFSGATNMARPVASVVRRSPLEKATDAPGVSLPFTSSTASVARSPETIRRGSRRIRAPEAGGACWASSDTLHDVAQANQAAKRVNARRRDIVLIVTLSRALRRAWFRTPSSSTIPLAVVQDRIQLRPPNGMQRRQSLVLV